MKKYFLTFLRVFVFACLALAACGGGSGNGTSSESNGTSPGTCETAGARICERACACAADGKCHVASKTDGGATAMLNFDNLEKCRNLYVTFGCLGGGTPSFDYASCDSAVAASSCVASAGSTGILLPDSCKSVK